MNGSSLYPDYASNTKIVDKVCLLYLSGNDTAKTGTSLASRLDFGSLIPLDKALIPFACDHADKGLNEKYSFRGRYIRHFLF